MRPLAGGRAGKASSFSTSSGHPTSRLGSIILPFPAEWVTSTARPPAPFPSPVCATGSATARASGRPPVLLEDPEGRVSFPRPARFGRGGRGMLPLARSSTGCTRSSCERRRRWLPLFRGLPWTEACPGPTDEVAAGCACAAVASREGGPPLLRMSDAPGVWYGGMVARMREGGVGTRLEERKKYTTAAHVASFDRAPGKQRQRKPSRFASTS